MGIHQMGQSGGSSYPRDSITGILFFLASRWAYIWGSYNGGRGGGGGVGGGRGSSYDSCCFYYY